MARSVGELGFSEGRQGHRRLSSDRNGAVSESCEYLEGRGRKICYLPVSANLREMLVSFFS